MFTVMIADYNHDTLDKLSKEIEKDKDFKIVGKADNGHDAYNIIREYNPDIVYFDLFLPYYDGFSLMEKIKKSGLYNPNTKYIMATPATNMHLASEIFHRGVDYVLTKPYDESIITHKFKRIYNIMNTVEYQTCGGRSTTDVISDALKQVGVPIGLTGYKYISTAINMVVSDDSYLESITKMLYPEIAKSHNSTSERVEKAIRHAIQTTWARNKDNLASFNFYIGKGKSRPTNSEFIAVLANRVKYSLAKLTPMVS